MRFINSLKRNLKTLPGWRTNRKLLVLESDDWGTIRVSSKEAVKDFQIYNIPVDQCAYNSNDALESNDDLERLFEVLHSIKDKNGKPAILTANNVVANPDFEKIRNSDFKEYYYEPFTETLKRYPNHNRVMDLYHEGIKNQLIMPQFHAREHLHVAHWMRDLQKKDKTAHLAFKNNMFSVFKGKDSTCRNEYLDAFGTYNQEQLSSLKNIITEGANLFEKIWGFRSKSVIAPCYTWHPEAESYFMENNIMHLQSGFAQKIPVFGKAGYKVKRRYMGQKNSRGQLYTIRNVLFEPSTNPDADWLNSTLKEIETAFRWKKPAIISTHRLNFMGSINQNNSSKNLVLLKQLLQQVVKKWPQVEFISSDQLGDIIRK